MEFVEGGLAAVCSGFITNPLEVVKTRMQLQGELIAKGHHAVHYKNVFHAGYVIAKHDGIWALQAGLAPALWFQLVINGYRFGLYQKFVDGGYIMDKAGNLILYKNILCSGFAGASGAFIASPFYLIKTHLQALAAKEIAFGHQHQYTSKGTFSGLWKIYKEQGMTGCFRGSTSAIPRAFVGSTSQLVSFTYCKQLLKQYDIYQDSPILISFIASMVGGVFISGMMTPFDLVSTRLYNQGVDEHGKGLLYKNYGNCVYKIWKSEGFLGFYKGLGPSYLRLGPHTVLCLVFWDAIKDIRKKLETKENLTS